MSLIRILLKIISRRPILVCVGLLVALLAAHYTSICLSNARTSRVWMQHVQDSSPAPDPTRSLLQPFRSGAKRYTREGMSVQPAGYRTLDGTVVVQPQYSWVSPEFSEGLAWASRFDGGRDLLDTSGAVVFSMPEHDNIGAVTAFSSGRASVSVISEGGWSNTGYVDRTGSFVVPARYGIATDFVGEYAFVTEITIIGKMWRSTLTKLYFTPRLCFISRSKIIDREGKRADLARVLNRR